MILANSPITEHHFNGHHFYLKRDDQLHSQFTGNKARKFMSLLTDEFPETKTLIGYGSPQANSLYSMAALASIRGWQFEFYVDHIPSWLIQKPIGNYRGALELDANIIETRSSGLHPRDYIEQIRKPDSSCLFVPEGGRSPIAELGVKQLGLEILEWVRMQPKQQEWSVALPSGTGTTALYLHKTLKPHGINVITCPCVGGSHYLTEQFNELGESSHPEILELENKHYFGHLYQQDYEIWNQLQDQTHIEFDLLYDPLMWRCLSTWLENENRPALIYIHQGGLLGNESMLPRYLRKFD